MAKKFPNRARMTVTGAAGTGALVLASAAAGFQSLTTAGMADGDTCSYVIDDSAGVGQPIGTAWEIGVGTYHSNGTFTRDTVTISSNGGASKISATTDAILTATYRGEDMVPSTFQALADVAFVTPGDQQIVRYNSGTGDVFNSSDITKTFFVQAGGNVITSAGTLGVTLSNTPTNGNVLIGFAWGGGGSALGSRLAPNWTGWDFVNTDYDASDNLTMAIRIAGASEPNTVNLCDLQSSGPGFLVGGVFEYHDVDISRLNLKTMFKAAFQNITTNPTTMSQRTLGMKGCQLLYFYAGQISGVTLTGPSVDDSGGAGGYNYVMGHATYASQVAGAVTALAGTGTATVMTLGISGYAP